MDKLWIICCEYFEENLSYYDGRHGTISLSYHDGCCFMGLQALTHIWWLVIYILELDTVEG